MNSNHLKAMLTALFFTAGLVITQLASANTYNYAGVVTSSSIQGFNLGSAYSLTFDVNGTPQAVGVPSIFAHFDSVDAEAVIRFDNGSVLTTNGPYSARNTGFSSSLSFGDWVINPPVLTETPIGRLYLEGPGQRESSGLVSRNFDDLMRGLDRVEWLGGSNTSLTGSLSLVSVVPEPSSYTLLLAGLGLIGVINFRMRS